MLSEYLTQIHDTKHANTVAAICSRFVIIPFDVKCASLAANLFSIGKELRQGGIPGGRACLRADTLIIASAKMYGAKVFYSDDDDCVKLAGQVMTAKKLPDQPNTLFE